MPSGVTRGMAGMAAAIPKKNPPGHFGHFAGPNLTAGPNYSQPDCSKMPRGIGGCRAIFWACPAKMKDLLVA